MAMTASGMANQIISEIDQCNDPVQANNGLYKGICDYVEANAEVHYAWAGVNPSGSPDPVVDIKATFKTSGSLSPSGATDCSSALAALSAALNANASLWTVVWPAGFALSPAFDMPAINITASGATDRQSALEHICQEIIDGIKVAATPSAAGAHSAYTGTATFTSIL